MRERLAEVLQKAQQGDRLSRVYDSFIVAVAFASMVPLMFKTSSAALDLLDIITVYILFADYVFRWMTYDLQSGRKAPQAFLLYPFTPLALLTLISLLPSMGLLGPAFRMLRLLRIFNVLHYSKQVHYIVNVFKKESRTLLTVLYFAVFYIFISALAMFAYEPDTFEDFFSALYWATTALTTVGYGDLAPVSNVGRLISMISSLFGIAIIAMPAGIVTAGFVEEINAGKQKLKEAQSGPKPDAGGEAGPGRLRVSVTPMVVRYGAVIAIGVLLNQSLNMLAGGLHLPLWLDVTGTAWASLVLGPSAGLIVGLIDNMILAIFEYGAGSLMYYAISASVAVITGAYVVRKGKIRAVRVIIAVLLVIIISTVLSALISLWVTRGGAPESYWENYYYQQGMNLGIPHIGSCFWGAFMVKIYDTAVTAVLAAVFYILTPRRFRRGLREASQ